MSERKPRVAVIMGSDSDFPVMQGAVEALRTLEVTCDVQIVSAHRTPDEMAEFAKTARSKGIAVIVAGAGGAAHLPGMVAAHSSLPVIGVPVPMPPLSGLDALYSMVQMPKGVPVATVAIGGAYNAGLLAAEILATQPTSEGRALAQRLDDFKMAMRQAVLAKKLNTEGP